MIQQMPVRMHQVILYALQCLQVPLPRNVDALRCGLPAGQGQQLAAQGIEPESRLRGQVQTRLTTWIVDRIDLVPDINNRCSAWQFFCQQASNGSIIGASRSL